LFNLSFPELVVMLLIVVVIFGATPLSGSDRSRGPASAMSRWSGTDWMLVIAALTSGFLAWALAAAR